MQVLPISNLSSVPGNLAAPARVELSLDLRSANAPFHPNGSRVALRLCLAAAILVLCCACLVPAALAQSGVWTWMGGSSTVPGINKGQPGVYGTLGTPAAANIPGGRGAGAEWIDHNGNVWIFGGYGFDADGNASYLNDLWELNPSTNEWTWVSGSSTIGSGAGQPGVYGALGTAAVGNVPGGRAVPSSWTDVSGNLWLFGGYGYDANGQASTLNDVWKFNPTSTQWTWVGGDSTIGSNYGYSGVYGTLGTPAAGNLPGSRYFSTDWTDSSGHFWLFGGYGFSGNGYFGYLNDLWEFDSSTNQWTWMGGGDSIGGDSSGPSGVYGTLGTPAAGNMPGGRAYAANWIDGSDNVWLFGGGGFDANGDFGYLNDLWELNPSNNEWTCRGGHNTVVNNSGQPGVYGILGTPAAGNTPGGRETAIGWMTGDTLWLFGGSGYDANDTFGSLGDLWTFLPATGEWTWIGGSSTPGSVGQAGVYGTVETPAASNLPGSRYYVANWTDSKGVFWLFGGLGEDANNTAGYLNDLWKLQPAAVLTSPAPGSSLTGTSAQFTWTPVVGAATYELLIGTTGVGSKDVFDSNVTTGTSATVSNLPTAGQPIYARLITVLNDAPVFIDYIYYGKGPRASLSATGLTYGSVSVGTSSASQSVTLTNAGNVTLSIGSISVTGTDASSFVFVNGCGASLAAGAHCNIHGHFAPVVQGPLTAAITIADSGFGSPQTVSLGGSGIPPPPLLSATSLAFGSEKVGGTTASQSVTMTNNGNGPLSISSISITGPDPASFVFANSCGTSLAAKAHCTIHGHFTATAEGVMTAAVTISDNAGNSPQGIFLSGTGLASDVSLSAASLSFGSVAVGTASASQSVTMTNTGNEALTISSIKVTGTGASSFDFVNSCGTSLGAGAHCTIHGHFTPTVAGALTAAITIADSADGSPQSIALSGTGQ